MRFRAGINRSRSRESPRRICVAARLYVPSESDREDSVQGCIVSARLGARKERREKLVYVSSRKSCAFNLLSPQHVINSDNRSFDNRRIMINDVRRPSGIHHGRRRATGEGRRRGTKMKEPVRRRAAERRGDRRESGPNRCTYARRKRGPSAL